MRQLTTLATTDRSLAGSFSQGSMKMDAESKQAGTATGGRDASTGTTAPSPRNRKQIRDLIRSLPRGVRAYYFGQRLPLSHRNRPSRFVVLRRTLENRK